MPDSLTEQTPRDAQAEAASGPQEIAGAGLILPAMLIGFMGLATLWGMFAKEDGYDWGGFDSTTFLQGLGLLGGAAVMILIGGAVLVKIKWAALLGLPICAAAFFFGLTAGYEWLNGGAEALNAEGASQHKILLMIAVLIIGSIVEAVLLVRVLRDRA